MIAAIYLRVSTDEQAEHGYSIAGQRDECKKKAKSLGVTETIEFLDEGISGAILERPGLLEAMDRIQAGGVSYIICQDSSRLSRSVPHQRVLIDNIRAAGTIIAFVNGTSGDSPEDTLFMTFTSAIDEYERVRIARRSNMGKKAKAEAGKLTHPPGTYGYKFHADTDTLSIVPAQAQVIKLMYNWLTVEFLSCYGIAKRLNEMAILSPKDKRWSRQTVRRILGNISYTGSMPLRKHDAKDAKLNRFKPPSKKVKRKLRPESEWIYIQIPQIIDSGVYKDAQRILKEAYRRYRGYGKHHYMLSGLIRCGECGATLHGNLISKGEKTYPYYVCTAKSPGIPGRPRCKLSNQNADHLDEGLWLHISSWIKDASCLDEVLSASLSGDEEDMVFKELRMVKTQYTALTQEQGQLVTLYQKRLVPEDEIEKRLVIIRDQITSIDRRRTDLERQIDRQALAQNEKNLLSELREHVGDRICSLSVAERVVIASMLIDSVVIKHEGIEVKVRAPIPPVANGALETAGAKDTEFLGRHNPPRGRPQAPGCH